MSVVNSIPLIAAGDDGYQISRSVRLRSSASAYFNRTLTTPTNNKIWTYSFWYKRGTMNDGGSAGVTKSPLFDAPSSASTFDTIYIRNADNLIWYEASGGATVCYLETTPVFRDPSAWYHFVIVYDSAQATEANRQKIYVNNVQITAFSTAIYVAQNTNGRINSAVAHKIGSSDAAGTYLDGYLTEVNFIDGQALTPSSFGETNAITGVWQPKKYAGTYGTNGFYLNFSDNSGATATTIGKDNSGNGNNWTPNNISVTAGVTYDSMIDVPTLFADGGNGRGNYATWNPLASPGTITNGNLNVTATTVNAISTTFFPSTGKWYWEVVCTSAVVANIRVGVINPNGMSTDLGGNTNGWAYLGDGRVYHNAASTSYGVAYATNDVLMIALDIDAGKIWYGKNGTWMASGVPSTGTSPSQTFTANQLMSPAVSSGSGTFAFVLNCGQRPFSYTPPTGFKALNTQNLPTPTISNGASYMAATLWTGNGGSQSIANTVNGVSFQPDFVWSKGRSGASNHSLIDSVRGITLQLSSNLTAADVTDATEITALTSTGFSVGNSSGAGYSTNANGTTYVGWQWNAGGSTVTNTSGSISSQVRANPTAGFSVVTYTGNGLTNQSVGHGLNATPGMVIIKQRSGTASWLVHHQSQPTGFTLYLNLTNAQDSGTSQWGTSPQTSSLFYVGFVSGATGSNVSASTYVAYCFAAVAGYSAFGSYTGNGSADGPFVFLGFRPRWLMIKRTDTAGESWRLLDTSRSPYNAVRALLLPDSSGAETSAADWLDILSNGFKLRVVSSGQNASGGTYIYACFAENPFKNSLAR